MEYAIERFAFRRVRRLALLGGSCRVWSAHVRGGALGGGGSPPDTPGPSLGELYFRPRRIRVMIQIAPPTTAAPISAQAHPGRLLDSEDGSLFAAAAAAAAAAAGAWLVVVVALGVVGVVTVWVLTTVFVCVCVGVVTVVVFDGAVTVLVWVTVCVCVGVVLVVVGVDLAAAVVADVVCADAVAVWFWEALVSASACVAVGVLPLVLAVAAPARPEAV